MMDNPVPHYEAEKQTTEKETKRLLKHQAIYEIYIQKIAPR